MNNERYNQIIDEAWKKYLDETRFNSNPEWLEPVPVMDMKTEEKAWGARQYHRNDFINKCKTDKEFSERWGLKIEERELSLGERGELFRKEYPNKSVDDFAPGGMEVQSLNHQLNTRYNNANIPTKLITITYNNETIEDYE
jgi:hypothetical protein